MHYFLRKQLAHFPTHPEVVFELPRQMQVTSNSGMWLDAFHLTSENSKNLDRGHGDETGYPDRTKHNICLYICGGPLSVIQGGTEHPGRQSTHLSKDTRWTLASQCIMTCTTQRAKINKPIIWSVTAKDTGVSLSWPVLAIGNTSICQECAAGPAKASGT